MVSLAANREKVIDDARGRRSYRSVRRARLQFGSRPAREPRSMIVDVGKRAA